MNQWQSANEIVDLSKKGKLPGYPQTIDGVRRRARRDGVPEKFSGGRVYFSLAGILQCLDMPCDQYRIVRKEKKKQTSIKKEKKKRLKADLLHAYLEKISAAPYGQKTETAKEFVTDYNDRLIYKHIYPVVGQVSYQTMERWKVRHRKEGETALLDKRNGSEAVAALTKNQEAVLIACIRHPNGLQKTEMVRLFRRKLDEKGLPFVPMSDRWIVRWIERWIDDHYDQYVQATRGHRATLNECAPFLRRDWNLLEVGDCLVADGHVWNGEIAHPVTGKPCRPVVLEFYDMRSNMVLGTEVMPTENIRSIASAFRRAVIRLGKYPKYVLLDNGKAFRAKFFKGCKDFEQAGIRSFYQKFCKEIIFAKVRNARSKPIERHFKDKGELERLSPSYVGTSINNKPARMIQGEVLHQRFWQKMTGGKLPTIEELYFAIVDWNENEYAYRKQEKSHLNGERPIDVLNAGLGAGVDVETLNELMLFEVDKKLEQNGIKLRINGADEYFYHEIFYGKRRRVRVRYDRYAIVSKVINWVEVNFDGEWYKAYRREKTHPLAYYEGTKADQEEVETQLKQQAHLVKQTEKDFREYVEADAKQYMSLPEPEKPALPTPVPVKNEIDVEAVLKVVDDLTSLTEEPQARPIFMSATERYKWLVGNPSAVSESDRQFMDEYSEGLYGLN